MSELSANELLELGEKIWKLKAKCEELQLALKVPQEELEECKAKMLAHFETLDVDKIHVKGYGTLSTIRKSSVKVPAGEARDVFFEHLSPEDYKALRTVNSASLNAWYEEKMQQAIEEGAMDFKIVGLEEPKIYKVLGMRKG
jgi:hypothetical protein